MGLPLNTKINSPLRRSGPSTAAARPGHRAAADWCPHNASAAMTGVQTMWSGFGKSVNTYFVQLEQTRRRRTGGPHGRDGSA